MKKNMPTRLSCKHSITNAMFLLLVLLEVVMISELAEAAPVKRNDILAGTEFLSVFINGAMAPTPRRRGFRRGQLAQDNVSAESRLNEASIFRISKAPPSPRPPVVIVTHPVHQQSAPKLYPISHKSQSIEHNHQIFSYPLDDSASTDDFNIGFKQTITSTPSTTTSSDKRSHHIIRINATKPFISNNINNNMKNNNNSSSSSSRKVIGVSVTSSVETATSYRHKINSNNNNYENEEELNVVTRPPIEPLSIKLFSPFSSLKTTLPPSTSTSLENLLKSNSQDFYTSMNHSTSSSTTTTTTIETSSSMPLSSQYVVTKELNNIVSESNRSELSVEEASNSQTTLEIKSKMTTEPTPIHDSKLEIDSIQVGTNPEPIEQSYELAEINPELTENHQEPIESDVNFPQGRKVGRHYDTSLYNQPPKVYQASKIYVDNTGAKIYSDTNKFYNKPDNIYTDVDKIYFDNKAEQQQQQVHSGHSKIYNFNERPMEPVEENYEVDEAVSVGSNGNVHGPQPVTPGVISPEDNHKVGYVVEGRNYRKYRVEERTPDGFIVGEYGVVSHDDGSLRGVRYTADGTINPRLIYDALMKFLAL